MDVRPTAPRSRITRGIRMRFHTISVTRAVLAVLCLSHLPTAAAQTPDSAELVSFDGSTRLDFAGSAELAPSPPATLEFWVSPEWSAPLDYDPCVLSALGAAGVNYAVHIGGDRRSIKLFAGDRTASAPFDFSDRLMHHVALIAYDRELTEVQVDGRPIGRLGLGFPDAPTVSFHLGSLDGEQVPFIGRLARLRLWDSIVDASSSGEDLAAQLQPSAQGYALAIYPLSARVSPAAQSGDVAADDDAAATTRRTLSPDVQVPRSAE
jgi:hypothetical protein